MNAVNALQVWILTPYFSKPPIQVFMVSFNIDCFDHQWKEKLQAQNRINFFSTKCGGIVHE